MAIEETKEARSVRQWIERIGRAEQKMRLWRENGKNIVGRYRGRDDTSKPTPTINLHWSNVQMLLATVYARTPQPEVVKRWPDNPDPSAQKLAETMQACLKFSLDQYDFDEAMEAELVDFWNTACGQCRIRYKPYFRPVTDEAGQPVRERIPVSAAEDLTATGIKLKFYDSDGNPVPADKVLTDDAGSYMEGDVQEEVAYEEVFCEYVPWDRFGWDVDAPTWNEVTFAWIEYHATRQQVEQEFGKPIAGKIEYDAVDSDKKGTLTDRAVIYEIFDKTSRQVISVCKNHPDAPLRVLKDPYRLEGFFPFPKPLWGTITSDKLVPVPLFQIVQDLYSELDDIQRRIMKNVSMLRVRGMFNAQYSDQLKEIFGKDDGYLAPLEQWNEMTEKGGLIGAIALIPLEQIYGALQTLVAQRESTIQKIYEVTGLSDIMRGASRASESAAAQKIKNEYMSTRINREVKKVARYVRDKLRIMAEMIAEHFSVKTIRMITGKDVTEEEWQVLRSDIGRAYKIDVQTDSMVIEDADAEVERRSTAVNAVASFMQAAQQWAAAGMLDPNMAKEIVMYITRATPHGRELEKYLEGLTFQPPAPPPDSSGEQAAAAQEKAAADQAKAASEAAKVEAEHAKLAMEERVKMADIASKERIAAEDRAAMLIVERAKLENDQMKTMAAAGVDVDTGEPRDLQMVEKIMQAMTEKFMGLQSSSQESVERLLQEVSAGNAGLVQALKAPRKLVRDPKTGDAVGSETVDN